MKGWFSALSFIGKSVVITSASVATLGTVGAISGTPSQAPLSTPAQVKPAVIEHKTVIKTEAIPFSTQEIDDPNLAAGTTQVQTEGVNGVKTKTWDVTLMNGVQTNQTLVRDVVTIAPVNKVILHGTYVAPTCPNGAYTNVDGVQVCSPSASNAGGATAICADGTYSYSLHRSGTCSHHGGVSQWL